MTNLYGRLSLQLFEIIAVSPGETWVLFSDTDFVIKMNVFTYKSNICWKFFTFPFFCYASLVLYPSIAEWIKKFFH